MFVCSSGYPETTVNLTDTSQIRLKLTNTHKFRHTVQPRMQIYSDTTGEDKNKFISSENITINQTNGTTEI